MVEVTDEMVERGAKAMFEHAVQTARAEFDKAAAELDNAADFFLGLRKESDAALVILSTSFIDSHLTDAWKRNMPGKSNAAYEALLDHTGPLATMSAKVRLAHGLSWITDELSADLHTLRKIRNKFAHDPYKQNIEDDEVRNLVAGLFPAEDAILKAIAGGSKPTISTRIRFHTRTAMIYHQLALQMLASPIAMHHHVPIGAILGTFEEGPETRRELARSQAKLSLQLLGFTITGTSLAK